jgi:lipoate-protein ligase A
MNPYSWRLLPFLNAAGAVHMAIDWWLFDQHCQGNQPSTLRFYTWSPVAISLGYHQRRYPPEWHHLTWQGQAVELVRRPTGGRAVLHQGNLTYALMTSGLKGNRMQAYEYLCQFLMEGWRSLGLPLHLGQASRGYIHNPNCFGTATAADLVTSDGAKFIGSAQLWRGDTVLQHGSIQLNPDPDLFQQVFGTTISPPPLPTALRQHDALSLMMKTLQDAACQHFQVDFVEQPLSELEWAEINTACDRFQVV